MGQFIQQADLQNALSPATLLALFDDTGTNVVNATAIAQVISEAEAEVLSYLVGEYPNPLPGGANTDELLKLAAVDFAVCFSFARKPEYTLQAGQATVLEGRMKRAIERMKRIQTAVQRPPTLATVATPKNDGGVVVDGSNRIAVDSSDGSSNMGDF